VLLRVEIGPDGHVHHATLERSSGHAVLDEAALGVIGTWLFDAATQGGRPVASTHTVPIQFHLEQ
jgi:protein TonB